MSTSKASAAAPQPSAIAIPSDREEPRADPRGELREESPQARAERRAAEILEHLGDIDQGSDRFYVNPDLVPPGWTYEWKRKTVLGKEDPAYDVQVAGTGWEAVPLARHRQFMPEGFQGQIIERDGMVLMERPAAITNKIKAMDVARAAQQVRDKEAQLTAAPKDHFGRDNKGDPLMQISKSREPVPIPE